MLYDLSTDTPLKVSSQRDQRPCIIFLFSPAFTQAFTGDTLFVGGVGRPDLVGALDPSATPEILSQNMFNSLAKLLLLGDDVEVLPAHGPGSPCGKGISADLSSTIGKEKASNPALQFTDMAKFVEFNIDGLGQVGIG